MPAAFTTTTIVRLVTDDGLEGLGGFDSDSYRGFELSSLERLRDVGAGLVGADMWARQKLDDDLSRHGTSPIHPGPLSAVDIALWDLAARAAGVPLFRLLGAAREALAAYASLPTMPDTGAYLDLVAQATGAGYGAVKLHASGEPARDIALHQAVREAFPELTVMHDAEGMYDRRGAARVAAALDELGARWFEAPLPDADLAGYREMRRRCAVPILPAGDGVADLRTFAEVLRDPPWDAIRSDVTIAGGVTFGCRLAELARAFGLEVELVSYGHTLVQAANLHVMLGLGQSSFFEQAFPVEPWEYGASHPVRAGADGVVRPPPGPGLGVELDRDAIEAATIGLISFD